MESFALWTSVAVLHAVEPFQIGAGLRAGNDIIGRNHILGHLQRKPFHLGAAFPHQIRCLLMACLTSGSVPSPRYSSGIPIRIPFKSSLFVPDTGSTDLRLLEASFSSVPAM